MCILQITWKGVDPPRCLPSILFKLDDEELVTVGNSLCVSRVGIDRQVIKTCNLWDDNS